MLLLPAKSHAAPPLFACKRAHNALACYQLFAEKGKGTAFSLPSGPRFCPSVFPAQPKIGRRCKVSADFYFFTIHDSLFTAWQGRFLEGNSEERRVKSCGGGALRRNKKRGKDAGPPQEKPPDVPTGSRPACCQLFADKGETWLTGIFLKSRRAKPRGIFLSLRVILAPARLTRPRTAWEFAKLPFRSRETAVLAAYSHPLKSRRTECRGIFPPCPVTN